MTAFSKRIAATAAAAALTAGGVFAVATPAFAATTTPPETQAAEQTVQVSAESFTSAEAAGDGITYQATGFTPNEAVTVFINGAEVGSDEPVLADADGVAVGAAVYQGTDELPEGSYTLTVEQGELSASTTFVIDNNPVASPTPTQSETTPTQSETETPGPTASESVPAEDATVVVTDDSLESGTTTINWGAAGFEPGATYTVTLVAPEATYNVLPEEGVEYVIDDEGAASGEIAWTPLRAFEDGAYVIVIETVEPDDSATVEFTIGAAATETPVPTETEAPAPTETETPAPTETETASVEQPTLGVEKDTYAQAETIDGVNYAGAFWEPGVEITIEVTEPNGATTLISPIGDPEADIAVDENGEFAGTVTYTTYEDTNGNGQYDAGESSTAAVLPIGDYVITATQGDVEETVTFQVVADAAESIPASDDDNDDAGNAGKGGTDASDSLAVTGADDAALLGMLAGGLVLVAAGATTMIVRRRQA